MSSFAVIFTLILTLVIPSAGGAAQSPSGAADGDLLLQAGKYREARDAFEAVLGSDPHNAPAQAGDVEASERLALQARAAGRMDDALQALLRARDIIPHNARLLFDLGILEDQMGLFEDADKSLAAADALNPGDPETLYGVARVKMDLGQLAAAQEKMEAYLRLRPDDASAHFGLGRIFQIGLQFDKARAEFMRSIALKPVQTESYFELGDLALKQGNFEEALAQFNTTLARDPRHGGALEGSGEALFKEKKFEQARDILERAIAAAPDYPPSHYYLGLTYARLGRKDDSERELTLASKLADKQNHSSAGRIELMNPAPNP
ncbi:MAG: tetratricopeptide repeat protein [Terracidiphilus sp.]